MNFDELKDIIQRDGAKIIIVENDKPQLVVMSFEEYKKKRGEPAQKSDEREREELTIDDLPI